MVRSFTTIVIALALIAVVGGGGCLGCWSPSMKAKKAGSGHCCNEKGQCERPGKAPVHKDCATRTLDLANVEQPASKLVQQHAVVATTVTVDLLTLVAPSEIEPPAATPSYSPPDLCLLNSVLLV